MQYIIIIVIALVILGVLIQVWPAILLAALGYGLYRFIRYRMKEKYFQSPEFLDHKAKIDSTINDYNEISDYVKSIPNDNQFIPNNSATAHSDLATFENTSRQQYKRDKNQKHLNKDNVYSTSLQVVRKASEQPVKYLCKYFGIDSTEESLNQLEDIGTNISRMENTVHNLEQRKDEIQSSFNPPKFILKYYKKELLEKTGMKVPEINVDYATYTFEYVSAGGNSSQKSTITFDGKTVEAVSEYISNKIKYNKSAKAQRSLMTNTLRNAIKERDNYTCQMCHASVAQQSLLLLEVDHIIPVSKGGMTTPDNLQTLCWKCNRSKSDKLITSY
ncbi:HNH endonuclease [Companilactobacillus hulinensis]|uniref:HNH endonuclease n=1 Tax=Companilactobacillus hulinensis TaxID=2486007 RepID=UPI000F79C413|nr:HNH endonuclease signature motif containing protein [Companilactobacillus hulinensis]